MITNEKTRTPTIDHPESQEFGRRKKNSRFTQK